MPDADGRIPPVSIPRVPWQEKGEEEAQEESAREFLGVCPLCGTKGCDSDCVLDTGGSLDE